MNNLESAVIDYLGLQSNCCKLITNSEQLKSSKLRKKAMEIMALDFTTVNTSNQFTLLNIEIVEEIVQNVSLEVNSELDVLHAIIRWLMKRGRKVEPCLLDKYSPKKTCTQCEDIAFDVECDRNELMVTLTGYEIKRLTKHIRLDRLALQDLKEMSKLCRDAKLDKLLRTCTNLLLEDPLTFDCTTPIPAI